MRCIASSHGQHPAPAACALAAVLCLFAGCVSSEYELEMSVEGETLHRRLVCRSEASGPDGPSLRPMPDGELEKIASTYGVETPVNGAHEFVFTGEFMHQLPDDIGGFGSLAMYEAEMGRTWVYVERFRGHDDLAGTLAEREQSMDELVDALTHWLGRELGDTPEFHRTRDVIHGSLRSDLHNVATYALLGTAINESRTGDTEENAFEMLVRLGQYGLERNYLSASDLPELVQVARGWDAEALVALVRRMLASKLGPDVNVADWRFLDSPENIAASVNRSLSDYPPYRAYLSQWRDKDENRDSDDVPEPADWVGGLVLRGVGFSLSGSDALRVRLNCPERPFRTNGEWSETDGAVVWNQHLASRGSDSEVRPGVLPAVFFALWSVPDESVQTEHFGRVILRGEQLAEYITWRAALPPEELAEWDDFISWLRPSTTERWRVEGFRFSSEPPPDDNDDDDRALHSRRGRELLLEGLDES